MNIPEHVIVLHGLGRSSRIMLKIASQLSQAGFRVHNLNYPSRTKSIQFIAENNLQQVLQLPELQAAAKIHFVGHSMGGIIVRYYLQHYPVTNLGRLVMIAPPNNGSELAAWLKKHWFYKIMYRLLFGPAGQQLDISQESIPSQLIAPHYEVGIIAGDDNTQGFFKQVMPQVPHDGKVTVESCKLANMKDFLIVNSEHAAIVENPRVIQQTIYFLKNGVFQHHTA